MSRKLVLILVFLLFCSPFVIPISRHATADTLQYDDFTVMANGSIYSRYSMVPPVTTSDNVTYTLTRNVTLYDWIQIERNNTILDGAGYVLTNVQLSPIGLELEEVSNVTVRNLNFENSGRLVLARASDCIVENNNFTNCRVSFEFDYSTNTTLSQNVMKNSTFGYLIGTLASQYMHSIDTSNTIDEKPVYYLKNQNNLTINPSLFPEIGFLALVNSTDIVIENLNLSNCFNALLLAFTNNSVITHNIIDNNELGILALSSSNNMVSSNELLGGNAPLQFYQSSCNNTVTGNRVQGTGGIGMQDQCDYNLVSNNNVSGYESGIWLYSFCSDNLFIGNVIENCSGEGLRLVQSQNNTIIKNTIMNTTRALRLEQVETCNNTFYHNNFENNKQQFLILGTIGSNIWDNGLEGNYWSRYNGTDSNQDGIGDTPYIIDANNTDHCPLMGTFQSFNMSATSQKSEEMDIVSNSTIEEVGFILLADDYPYPIGLVLTIQGQNGTTGFCRITLQNDLLNSSVYPVYMPEYSITSRIVWSNGTHTTFYFIYNQLLPDTTVFILPEFPSFLILPMFMIATLLAIVIYKRRHLTIA